MPESEGPYVNTILSEPRQKMDKYVGVKIVHAVSMDECTFLRTEKEQDTSDRETRPGYKVIYPDHYISWSPKDVFEEAYRKIDGLTFGLAVETAKKGFKVARQGWNGKGMYVQLNPAKDFEFSELCPYFTIKNVRNSFDTWVPSISDILAEDWQIIE